MKLICTTSTALPLTICGLVFALASGCTVKLPAWQQDVWINGYQLAENRAAELETGMVICYRNTPPNRPDKMIQAAQVEVVGDSKSEYVRCILSKAYAPDRKYVAQFGVDRSPALIVLHPDGTYHAHTGFLGSEGIRGFLASASPPGKTPNWNPFLYRKPRYTWMSSTEEAEAIANETNRSMLIIFHRPWSNDWQRLNKMLNRPAVFRRVSDMIHVKSGSVWSFSDEVETKYGTLRLPAIVIAQADGTHRILEHPEGYDTIIRFADNKDTIGDVPPTEARQGTSVLGAD